MATKTGQKSGTRDATDASRFCLEAIELIYRLGLQPTPPIYALIYSYAAQNDVPIGSIIRKALTEERPLSDSEVKKLDEHCLVASESDAMLHGLTDRLNDGVSEASSVLGHAAEAASSYCRSLDGTQGHLANLRDPDKLASVVADLVKSTQEMRDEGSVVQKRLSELSCEVELVKQDLDKVRLQSHVDSLTNTGNRRLFDRALAAAVADAEAINQSFCLCMVDADRFKEFNDRHGHQAGDSVLKLIASILKSAVRDGDIVTRYGGEEFAILLSGADLITALKVAERIRRNVSRKKLLSRGSGESLGSITVSIGVAQYAHAETVTSLLERADKCLYQAKHEGRNRVVSERLLEPQEGNQCLGAVG